MLAVPGDVILVIDALDEHPAPRKELLEFLATLSRDHHNHLRLLVTSRSESDIDTAMKAISATEIDISKASEQKRDIYKYITSVIESDKHFQTLPPRTLDLIKESLFQESMFVISLSYYNLCY
jgi:hypothetical protein